MADQASTPTSAADSSVAGGGSSKPPNSTTNPSGSGSVTGGSSAPKDKACPFCGQPFTSSSLGRHLDLYIKEKNPKPADGLHDVDEIRKMRGAITRRQPRGSSGRREGSTPAGTPGGTPGVGLRGGESEGTPSRSNSGGRVGIVQRQPMTQEKGKVTTALNQVNWQSTGVINNIPIMHQRNDLNGGGGSNMPTGVADGMAEGRRTVSRQIAAKNTFEQKQKMLDAMEGQRAAELALREILGSIEAAITVAQPSLTASPFDFDPTTLSFPSLVLTCLPPPPTISQISPIANPNSWFTDPPSQVQLKALGAHFRERFHNANVMRTLNASTPPHPDDILYAHHAAPEVQAAIIQQAKQYEDQVTSHLHQAFQHWMQTPPATREDLWKLELARFVGQKSQKVTQLEQLLESIQQENAHLKYQVESLSRLQNPKEFAMSAPQTLSLNRREAVELAELGMRGRATGFRIGDNEESIQKRVEQAVERWKPVVRRSRAGMQNQRSLSGQMRPGQSMAEMQGGMAQGGCGQQMNGMSSGEGMELDAEADMDADAEADEENYNNQAQAQMQQQQRSETSTPIMQQHMIQAGYPNIGQQQQQQAQNLRGQQQNQQNMGGQNINGMAMMNLQQQHAAQQAQQQAHMQNQGMQIQNQGQQQQMNQGQGGQQQGDVNINGRGGQHQGMNQQQQMAAMRRQQQQSGVAAQMNGSRAGVRINGPPF